MKEKTLLEMSPDDEIEFEHERYSLTYMAMLSASKMLRKHRGENVEVHKNFGEFSQTFQRISLSCIHPAAGSIQQL